MTPQPVPSEPRALLEDAMWEADHSHGGYECCAPTTHGDARDVADSPAGVRLLALAADGLAVERLRGRPDLLLWSCPFRVDEETDGDYWVVEAHGDHDSIEYRGPTLPAAVEAALGEQGGQADG